MALSPRETSALNRQMESRVSIWLESCPGFMEANSHDGLIDGMKRDAQIPQNWYEFESSLSRAGYKIEFKSGRYVCNLPTGV